MADGAPQSKPRNISSFCPMELDSAAGSTSMKDAATFTSCIGRPVSSEARALDRWDRWRRPRRRLMPPDVAVP
jgi:hypothetical protein